LTDKLNISQASVGSISSLVAYDGLTWSGVGGGVYGGDVLALAQWNDDLYVGGSFLQVGDVHASRLARWDGTSWMALGDFNGNVRTIAIHAGSVYVGGDFTRIGTLDAIKVARYASGVWYTVGGGVKGGTVFTLASADGCMYSESCRIVSND
jgi:hypothetical protein